MDAVSMIVTALATGAVAGLKPTAEQAIKDAYSGLKCLIHSRFSQIDITPLEQRPNSKIKQASVSEDLVDAGADRDEQVLLAAQALIKLIEGVAPEAAEVLGVTIDQLRVAGTLNIEDVVSAATGVSLTGSTVEGDVSIKGIRAGEQGNDRPNP